MSGSGSNLSNAWVDWKPGCSCGTGACRSTRLEGNPPVLVEPLLPTDASARKGLPIGTAVLDYFPDALAEIAKVSLAGQKQHNTKGWDRSKSNDEADALVRHFLERGRIDSDGLRHSAKLAWRALALLQKEIEQEAKAHPAKEDHGALDPKLQVVKSPEELIREAHRTILGDASPHEPRIRSL